MCFSNKFLRRWRTFRTFLGGEIPSASAIVEEGASAAGSRCVGEGEIDWAAVTKDAS